MKRRSIAIVASVALAFIVAFSGFLATRHVARDATLFTSPLLGHLAPQIDATTLDGQHVSLTSMRGHVVVVNFWASWCDPCVQEAPELSTFAWQERSRGVKVLGVVWNDELASARAFQTKYGSLYPSAIDSGGSIANAYGITSPPTTFVINSQGVVAATLIGATTAKQLSAVVARVS